MTDPDPPILLASTIGPAVSAAIGVALGIALGVLATLAWRRFSPGRAARRTGARQQKPHRRLPPNFGAVDEGKLYRSARVTPAALQHAAETLGVRTLIDLGAEAEDDARRAELDAAAHRLGVRRVQFRLSGDGSGDPNFYAQALRIMADPSAQPVLVHCAAGAQRTGAVVMLYRHLVQHKRMKHVYEETFDFGHDPAADWRMLAYLAEWTGEIARAVRTGEMIPWQRGARATHTMPGDAEHDAATHG
jgi:protein tyrosine phosphatase (PTP) superfamily phosphohydrolase (DUF442 family)